MLFILLALVPILLSSGKCALQTSVPSTPSPTPQGAVLPAPSSLLDQLFQTTTSLITTPWTDTEADSRQGPPGVIRITVGAFFAAVLAAVLGVVGFGGVGLIALKALSVGSLALLLAAATALKHKSSSGSETVHYVPMHSGGSHHDYLHDRSEFIPPYLDRNI